MKILIIEDNPSDAELIRLELRKNDFNNTDHASDWKEFNALYEKGKYDLILSDYNLNGFFGTEILVEVRKTDAHIPFIFVSGAIGEEKAVEILKQGATDYVLKGNLIKLSLAINRALKEVESNKKELKAQDALQVSEERNRALIENMNEGILLSDENGKILFVNPQFSKMTGYTFLELIGKNGYEILVPNDFRESLKNKISFRKSGLAEKYEMKLAKKDGSVLLISNSASPVVERGKFIGVMSVMTDITQEKRQEKLLQFINNSLDVVTGEGYFSEVTKFLYHSFEVKLVMIASYSSSENAAETISFLIEGKPVDNITYGLENTPCSNVVGKKICIYPEKVQELFPLDLDLVHLNAQSYIGVPLFDSNNFPSGLIVLVDNKPMIDVEEKKLVLSMLAGRAGAELQRSIIQKSLVESEIKYKKVVEDQTEFIFRWLPGGKVIFANRSFQKFHNLTEEEILKKNLFDLVNISEHDRVKNKIEKLNREVPALTDTHQSTHPVYGTFWHEWTDRAFFDESGIVIEFQSIGRDITAKKNAEFALIANEKQYRTLFKENPNPMYVVDMETLAFLEVNGAAIQHYGYSEKEFLSMKIQDIRSSSQTEKLIKHIDTIGNKVDRATNWKHLKKDGTEIEVEITTNPVEYKNRNARLVLAIDVTDRNRALEKVKETAGILDLVNSLILVVNRELKITYVAPSVNKMLGYSPEELLGDKWWGKTTENSSVMDQELKRVRTIFIEGITNENTYYERVIKTKNGEQKWIGWEKSLTADGLLIGVGQDITKKKKAEIELEESEKFKDSILSALSVSIAVIDTDGEIIAVNNTWKKFASENGGKPVFTGVGSNYLTACKKASDGGDMIAKEVLNGINTVLSRLNEKFEFEYPCHSESEERWFHMVVTPFSGSSGGVVISHYDISEKKIHEGKIQRSFNELKNIDLLNKAVIEGNSSEEISKILLNSFLEINNEITGRVYFLDKKANKLILKAEHLNKGVVSQIEKKTGFKINSIVPSISEGTYFGQRLKTNENLFLDNHKEIIEFVESHTTNGVLKKLAGWSVDLIPIKAVGILPLSIENELFGLITITAKSEISSEVRKIFIRFAEQAAGAIAKKVAEDKLSERENYLSALIESIPDMLFRLDKAGVILDYKSNDGNDGKSGHGGNLIGHNYLRLLPKNVVELHNKCVIDALRTGKIINYDFEIEIPGGQAQYYETRIKGNSVDELVLIVRDISKKKLQEQLIREKEQKLNEAQKIAKVGSWHLDIINNILEWSDEAYRIFEVEVGTKLTLEKFLSFVHPLDRDFVGESWNNALAKKIYDIEHRILVEGKTKWVREIARVEFDANGVAISGLGTVQDITSKKRDEQELLRREELLSFSHKLSKIGYYTWNQNTDDLFWSNELFQISGYDAKLDKPSHDLFQKLIHKEDQFRLEQQLESILKNPCSFELDYRIVTDAGLEKHIKETCEIQENQNGEKLFIGVVQDVTEVKDFENVLLKREKQIQRSNKLNTRIIETSDQFFYVSKVGQQKLYGNELSFVSPQVEEIFGIALKDFKSNITIWHDSIHEEDRELVMSESLKMYQTKQPLTIVYRCKNKLSGNYIWVEDYVCPYMDENGVVIELYGSVQNIDEKKRAEDELLKRERLLREAQRIAKLGSWEWNLTTNQVLLNDEMCRILEINPDQYEGNLKNLFEFISPESIPRFKDAITNASLDYKSVDVELQIVTAKGNERKLLLRASEHKEISEAIIVARGTALDITELWKTHAALFETEDRFKKIFESVTDVYYQTDLNGVCTMISPSCEKAIGYSQQEMVGKTLTEIYEFPEERQKLLGLILNNGMVNNYEISLIAKDGHRIYVSANISLLTGSDGKPYGLQGIVRDVSEKRKNDLDREHLLLELTNKYNQLMQFNYIVSHNLRSPITNLLGLSSMFTEEISYKEKEQVVLHMRNSVLAMDGLVKDLNMILATRTAINENKENIDLKNIIETIKNNLNTQIEESEAMLVSDIADDNDQIYTIKSYFQSILYNLVNNAIKYRSAVRPPVVIISCQKNSGNTIVSVTDNGNGIDVEKFGSQLFGLYKRFDLSKEGRGLGLHMTKTQVEALGGTIAVESEVGKGTKFTITLPD